MMTQRPLFLITNDDGVMAPGISALVDVASTLGDVCVVAPNKPQSGMGHAITFDGVVRVEEVLMLNGTKAWSCSGTPADCVKLGLEVLVERQPTYVLSGINHGSNMATSVTYSGTLSAALEGAMMGIRAIGFSLCNSSINADFTASKHYVEVILKQVLEHPLPERTCLNVNIPNVDTSVIKGIKVCREGMGYWKDNFEKRLDPKGKQYFWLSGYFVNEDQGDDYDTKALEDNYVSVVPLKYDLTDYEVLKTLKF